MDCNGDNVVDISDLICISSHLFGPGVLPCGDGTAADPGNIRLLDANGDGGVDLSDAIHNAGTQFGSCTQGAPCPPPENGTECTLIEGCEDADPPCVIP